MEILGIIGGAILFYCIAVAFITGRIRLFTAAVWCVPIIGLGYNYKEGMEINGLVIVICTVMILIMIGAIYGVRLWNIKERKKTKIIYFIVYIFVALFVYYCYFESMRIGYIHNFSSIGIEVHPILTNVIFVIFALLLAKPCTTSVLIFTERFFSGKKELILIRCSLFVGREANTLGIWNGYYLNGINNGKMYHFKMTKRTFYMLRKEKNFKFEVRNGCFGGLYITRNPYPANVRRVKKRDVRDIVFLTLFSGIYFVVLYFIFY